MFLRTDSPFRSNAQSFNMTPIIDIVFLLIIFFLVVSQFIEAENFPVDVPDGCEFAETDSAHRAQITTVTVMKTIEEGCEFAVGSEKIAASKGHDIVGKLTELINACLTKLPSDHRVVTLRVDRDVCFADAQYALAAIAASGATDIQLAALKGKRTSTE